MFHLYMLWFNSINISLNEFKWGQHNLHVFDQFFLLVKHLYFTYSLMGPLDVYVHELKFNHFEQIGANIFILLVLRFKMLQVFIIML